jgi:hypothetical protein
MQQTHIDQSYWAAIGRVRVHLGEDAAQKVLDGKTRAIICNIWRPLFGPLFEQPLASADFRTLNNERDFDETPPAPPGCRTGESQMLRYHPDQKWYYLSGMQTDECMLLKCFDSLTGVRSPHSVRVYGFRCLTRWTLMSVLRYTRHSSTLVRRRIQRAGVWKHEASV